jgi:hypothetical protein
LQIKRLLLYESSVLFTNTAKSLIWLFRMNKLITKYNALALCKLESLSLSTALLAMAETLVVSVEKRHFVHKLRDKK